MGGFATFILGFGPPLQAFAFYLTGVHTHAPPVDIFISLPAGLAGAGLILLGLIDLRNAAKP